MKAVTVMYRIFCACILILAIVEIGWMHPSRGAEGAEGAEPPEAVTAQAATSFENVPKEMEGKRVALEAKERDLQEQDRRMQEREKEIDRKIKEMENLRAAVTGELENQKKNNEERVVKMVSVFETMSPKSASGVLETLDDWLAVEVLKRMDVKRVAKVMNIMDKTRSAKLSEMLTGYYKPDAERKISSVASSSAKVPAPAGQEAVKKPETPAVSNLKKGGEK